MAQSRDFYEVLGVDRNSDADSIKKAYRKLAMQFHPDKNPGDAEAEERFKEAAAAYEVLSNPEKKARYDRFGHAAYTQSGGGAQYGDVNDIFSNFGDIFEDLFGMGGGGGRGQRRSRNRNEPRRGADLRYITEISLEEVLSGAEQEVQFETEQNCKDCNGTGGAPGSQPTTCSKCHGAGQVVMQQGFFTMSTPCPQCQGEGTMIKDPCKTCRGRGRQQTKRKISVKIPPGVDSGTRLRVGGEGEGGYRGGPNGDLFVEIRVVEHEVFQREGDHLFAELEVPYLYFLLGGEYEAPTLDGQVTVDIPKGVEPGEKVRVAGQGIPSLRGSRRGDLYYILQPHFPKKLGKDEERLLKEIAKAKESDKDGGFFSRKK